ALRAEQSLIGARNPQDADLFPAVAALQRRGQLFVHPAPQKSALAARTTTGKLPEGKTYSKRFLRKSGNGFPIFVHHRLHRLACAYSRSSFASTGLASPSDDPCDSAYV